MCTIEEITDYANNHDPITVHMGLEEFRMYRRRGISHTRTTTTAGVGTTTETGASACSSAPSRTKIPGRNSMLFEQ